MLPDYFFDLDAPFVVPFSLEHVIYLISCAVIYCGILRHHKKLTAHGHTLRWWLLLVIALQQISQYSWYWMVYEDPLKEALPLQMCRVCSILNFLYFLTRKDLYIDLEFYYSLFVLGAMIYPMGCYRLIHIDGISYMINHLVSLITPPLAILVYGWRPGWRSFRRASAFFCVYLPVVIVVNRLTGGNYFYLVDRPFFKTMPNLPCYLLAFAVTIGGCALMTGIAKYVEKKLAVPV